MSTRCHIAFYEKEPKSPTAKKKFEALLYKHSDGYPEGVLPTLIPFALDFDRKRGLCDCEYAAAHCITVFINDSNDGRKAYDPAGNFSYLGYGIAKAFHGDIEYAYVVSPGLIQVYATPGSEQVETWVLLGEVTWTTRGKDAPKFRACGPVRNMAEICDSIKQIVHDVPVCDPEDDERLEFPSPLQKCLEKLISVQYGDREKFKNEHGIYSMKSLTKGQAKYYIKMLKEGEDA
jgi:hypothetical protein